MPTPIARTALLAIALFGCSAEPRRPQGKYTLDSDASRGFTETRLVMKEGIDRAVAEPLARQLVESAKATAELRPDGTAFAQLTLGAAVWRALTGTWQIDGRTVTCSAGGEEPITFTYADGSDTLEIEVPIDGHRAVLLLLPASR
jgi:hypothetical protein